MATVGQIIITAPVHLQINMTKIKKFFVNIEQPLCASFEVMAKDEEQAEEMARKKYAAGEFIITNEDIGTDAQFQVLNAKGEALTEWN